MMQKVWAGLDKSTRCLCQLHVGCLTCEEFGCVEMNGGQVM